MDAASLLRDLLHRSGVTKATLARESGVSRALIDDYLAGRRQPSLRQAQRIAQAAGFEVQIELKPFPPPVPPEFLAVLEFGELFPRKEPMPLINLGPVWRQAAAGLPTRA